MNTTCELTHNIHKILQSAEETRRSIPSRLRAHITDFFRKESGRSSMLNVTVQKLGDVSILHCRGRILFGNTSLHDAALWQKNSGALVLDLAQVDGIDAGGLGVLLDLRAWAQSNGVQLKLLNVMPAVQRVLESTRLNLIFEVCSVHEMFHLLGRAHGVDAPLGRRTDQSNAPGRELHGGDELQQTRN